MPRGISFAGKRPSQTLRKIVLAISIAMGLGILLISNSYWPDGGLIHESIEWVGIVLITICVAGRTWCTLYIGGRKYKELMQDGPYSIVRHPLYVFSIIGAVGVGAQAGGFTVAVACGFLTWAVFLRMAMIEENAMLGTHGTAYSSYMTRVPRFAPKFSLHTSKPSLVAYPRHIATTFFDAAIFFVAVPIMELSDYLHEIGWLPTLLRLP